MITRHYKKTLTVKCPVCKSTVLKDNPDTELQALPTPCEHLRLWHNEVTDFSPFIHPSMKRTIKDQEGPIDPEQFKKMEKKGLLVNQYVGEYLGGCQYIRDIFVFENK